MQLELPRQIFEKCSNTVFHYLVGVDLFTEDRHTDTRMDR